MKPTEILHFLKGLRSLRELTSVGALLPTWPPAARALIHETVRRTGPKRILEVGSGTGAVTDQLVRHLGSEDRLTLCEINQDFVAYLRGRFEREPHFARVRGQVEIEARSVLDLEGSDRFDHIVSVVPFNSLPPGLIGEFFDCYRRLLAPSGTLSYLEYVGIRQLRLALTRGRAGDSFRKSNLVLEAQLAHEVYRDTILANFPPAWVHNLRFDPPRPEEALFLRPLDRRCRVPLGPVGVARDALNLAAGLGAVAALLRQVGVRPWRWPLGLALAGAAFLRDPRRPIRPDPGIAFSACDGRVLAVERIRDPHLGEREWLRISAFLALTDAHVNRVPVAGLVADRFEVPGGTAPAMLPGAENNRSCYTVLNTVRGPVVVAQRVGVLARRIANWVRPGELVAQGQRYGLIRMGSRTDVYVPAEKAEALVRPGDRVLAGLTPVACYTDAGPR